MNNDEKDLETNETEKIKEHKVGNAIKRIPKVIKYIFILVILLVIIFFGIKYSSVFTSQIKTTKLGLENVGELVTQTAYLTVVRDNKDHREIFNSFKIPFTESRQIFSYDIEVDASVDFSKITYIVDNENEIIIKLPHAEIYKATLNTDSFMVYLDSESLFSRIDLKENNEALKAMEEQAIEDAKANGILEAADENAKRLIDGLVKSNDEYKECNIIYEYIGG